MSLALVNVALAAHPLAAHAQQTDQNVNAASSCSEDRCFVLLGVTIDGASAINAADLAPAYERYLTQQVSIDDLARIADAITADYRSRGFFLSRAMVPPQDFSTGLAHLVVLEGRITEIRIEGPARHLAEPLLRGIDHEPIATLADLDRRLTLCGDIPGVSVQSRLEPVEGAPADHRLVVTTSYRPLSGWFGVDNRGSESEGRLQTYGGVSINSRMLDRDEVSLRIFTTPAQTRDYSYVEGRYRYMFQTGASASLLISRSRSHDGADPITPRLGGNEEAIGVTYEFPLLRRHGRGLWLGGSIEARHDANDWWGGGAYEDDLRIIRTGLRGFLDEDGRSSAIVVRTSFGLDALGATSANAADKSRADADGSFVSLLVRGSHYRDLGRHFGLYAATYAQWSDSPLLQSEEFTIGGAQFGRAYEYAAARGDRGIGGLLELRAGYDPDLALISFLQGYIFADAAQISNIGAGTEHLSSAGFGMRLNIEDWLIARAEFARPLDPADSLGRDDDWRQFFSLSASY